MANKDFDFKWHGKSILVKMKINALANMKRATLIAVTEAKRLSSQKGTGKVYHRRRVVHQASSPGSPFASDTGSLRSRITNKVEQGVGLTTKGYIGGKDKRFYWLEFGTSDGHIAPRPTLRPAIANKKAEIVKELGKDLI